MPSLLPLHFLLLAVTGWANCQQAEAVAYLVGENRILRSKLPKRVPLANTERIRLAELGRRLGRRVLKETASIGTPDTIHLAAKYDSSAERTPASRNRTRPPKPQDLRSWAARLLAPVADDRSVALTTPRLIISLVAVCLATGFERARDVRQPVA